MYLDFTTVRSSPGCQPNDKLKITQICLRHLFPLAVFLNFCFGGQDAWAQLTPPIASSGLG